MIHPKEEIGVMGVELLQFYHVETQLIASLPINPVSMPLFICKMFHPKEEIGVMGVEMGRDLLERKKLRQKRKE
jgi:hypothetical protein